LKISSRNFANGVEKNETAQPVTQPTADPFGAPLDLDTAKQRARNTYLAEVNKKASDARDELMRNFDTAIEDVRNFFELVQVRVPWPGSQLRLECSPLQFSPGVAANILLHMSGEEAVHFGTLPFFAIGPTTNVTVAESTINLHCAGLDFAHVLDWFVQLVEDGGTDCLAGFFPAARPDGYPLGLETLITWFATGSPGTIDTRIIQECRKNALGLLKGVSANPECKNLVRRAAEKIMRCWPADDPDLPAVASMLIGCLKDDDENSHLLGKLLSTHKDRISVLRHLHKLATSASDGNQVADLHELVSKLPAATLLPLFVDDNEDTEWMNFV
jgi:hypothetical protein